MQTTLMKWILLGLSALLLSACGGSGGSSSSGSSEAGISTAASASHFSSEADMTSNAPDASREPAEEAGQAKSFYRSDNMYIEQQLGLASLQVVELVSCDLASARPLRDLMLAALNLLVPAAHAHAAHIPSGPAGVIDVQKPDFGIWHLGLLGATDQDYCGVRIRLSPVTQAPASEDEADLRGKSVLVGPCYYPDTANSPRSAADSSFPHACIEAAYAGPPISRVVSLERVLRFSRSSKHAELLFEILYDRWLDDIDMTQLATSEVEQRQLAQNVLDSISVYSINQ